MIVVDRIEGPRAVLEVAGELLDVPLVMLPSDVREGDVLVVSCDLGATAAARASEKAPTPDPAPADGILDL